MRRVAKKEFQESFLVAQHVSHPPYHQQHHIKSLTDLLQIFWQTEEGWIFSFHVKTCLHPMTWNLEQICAWKCEIGRYRRYCEVSSSAVSRPALLVPELPDFRQRSTDLSTFFICHIHQKLPLPGIRRHIEKVIWGQNQRNLHNMLLTDLWSFLTDLFEIWSTPRPLMQIEVQVLTENYSMPEMKEETFAQLLLSILILLRPA